MTAEPDSETPRRNPFPGLRPFGEDDAPWFFGRSEETRSLLDRLSYHRLIAVVGSSGCGKSSLVHASLIPALRAGYDSPNAGEWRIAKMRPGSNPIGSLSEGLLPLAGLPGVAPSKMLDRIDRTLRQGSLGVVKAIRNAREHIPEDAKIVILVDQFEELFTIAARNPDLYSGEIREFVNLLLDSAWTNECAIHVVLTMRSENLGMCARFGDLATAINNGLFLVPKLSNDRVRDVIELPLEEDIEPALVTKLINELNGERDDLPLLQHALMRLWEAREKRDPSSPVSFEDLDAVGDIGETISRQIDDEIFANLDKKERDTVYALFLEITEVGEDSQMNRRPRSFGELLPRVDCDEATLRSLIDAFREERRSFLQPSREECRFIEADTMIDISHESLIRQWDGLNKRARERMQLAEEIDLIGATARDWVKHGRAEDYLESNGLKVERAGQLARARPMDFSQEMRSFIKESDQRLQLERVRKRHLRLAFALGAAIIAAVVVYALFDRAQVRAKAALEVAKAEAKAISEAASAAESKALAEAAEAKAALEVAKAEAKAIAEAAEAKAISEAAAAAEARAIAEAAEARAFAEAEAARAKAVQLEKAALESELARSQSEQGAEIAKMKALLDDERSESAQNRARVTARLAEIRKQVSVLSYESILRLRALPDSSLKIAELHDNQIEIMGLRVPRADLEQLLNSESRKWPVRRFTLLAPPSARTSDTDEEASVSVSAYLHFEFWNRGSLSGSRGDPARAAAGLVKEIVTFRFDESLNPIIHRIDREDPSPSELLTVLDERRSGLIGEDSPPREEIAINLFWRHEIDTAAGRSHDRLHPIYAVIEAPRVETPSSEWPVILGATVFDRPVRNDGIPGGALSGETDTPPQWIRLEISVSNGSTPKINSIRESVQDGISTIPVLHKPPWPTTAGEIEEWLHAYRLLQTVEDWRRGSDTADDPNVVALAFAELYLLCGNPFPIREQIDFFSEQVPPRRYYGRQNRKFFEIAEDLASYKQSRQGRKFWIADPPPRVAESSGDEWTVDVSFRFVSEAEFENDPPETVTVRISVRLEPDSWPYISEIGPAP